MTGSLKAGGTTRARVSFRETNFTVFRFGFYTPYGLSQGVVCVGYISKVTVKRCRLIYLLEWQYEPSDFYYYYLSGEKYENVHK